MASAAIALTPGAVSSADKMINKEFRVMGQWLLFSLPPQHYPRMGSNTVAVTLLSTVRAGRNRLC